MNLDVDKLSDVKILFIEDNHLILTCTTKELIARTFREAFNQYFERFAYIALVAFLRELILQIDHSLQATHFLFFRNRVGQMFGGIGSRAFGILEQVSAVVSHFAHQRKRFLIIFLRLGMESTEQVGRNRTVRNY